MTIMAEEVSRPRWPVLALEAAYVVAVALLAVASMTFGNPSSAAVLMIATLPVGGVMWWVSFYVLSATGMLIGADPFASEPSPALVALSAALWTGTAWLNVMVLHGLWRRLTGRGPRYPVREGQDLDDWAETWLRDDEDERP